MLRPGVVRVTRDDEGEGGARAGCEKVWSVPESSVSVESIERCARLALAAIHREYPYHLVHVVRDERDVQAPRALTPAFWGAFDWHSAVHGHWCVARAMRYVTDPAFQRDAEAALALTLTPERLDGECRYLAAPGREGFERPYGLAWLLQLAAELEEWRDPRATGWASAVRPLAVIASAHLIAWLPKLSWPDRAGQHGQTAFSLGIALDAARVLDDRPLAALIEHRTRDFYLADRAAPVAYEPSGHDFLSPALAEADLMRRVLPRGEFARWLEGFLPPAGPTWERWLTPVASPDRADGKLAHLDGLNLSRAWMLDGVAGALDPSDARRTALAAAAERHLGAGLAAVGEEHYAGSHWLGSFAVYALTRRGAGSASNASSS
jgi:hypothetical protein